MRSNDLSKLLLVPTVGLLAFSLTACTGGSDAATNGSATIKIVGSDTMVNLSQRWAERYQKIRPNVSVQLSGGGSGVGIAALIEGTIDLANSSRDMKADERALATQRIGVPPKEFVVGKDALAIYVHKDNPIESISLEELAEIYGENGTITRWSQIHPNWPARGASDEIVVVNRQNNSGTYATFRDEVLGKGREFRQGTLDQSGSKDVVNLVGNTFNAIGYSGMAYGTPDVKMLAVSRKKGETAVEATAANALNASYPLARNLNIYSRGEPEGAVKEYLDWILGPDGQNVVEEIGYVPVRPTASAAGSTN